MQDKDGDEDWHLYAKALDDSPARELTPFKVGAKPHLSIIVIM
jgi:hypothetical protein